MKTCIFILCAAVSCVTLPACKKPDGDPVADRNALLTRGKWLLNGYMTYTSAGPTDNYSSALRCIKDNTFSFGTDGYIVEDEGATKCDSAYPQQRRVQQWKFRDDGRLNWNDGDIVWFYNINQLDSNVFTIEWEGDDPHTLMHHRDVITYRHQ